MNRFSAAALVLTLVSGPLLAEEPSSAKPSGTSDMKDLPALQEKTALPEVKNSNLTQSSDYIPSRPDATTRTTVYSKEQMETLNKNKNWAVEGLKDRREADRLELEKLQKTEKSELDELLEKERKSIDERIGKPTSQLGQLKPSIETNWDTLNTNGANDAEKRNDLQSLGQLQNTWIPDELNNNLEHRKEKESVQAFDSSMGLTSDPSLDKSNNANGRNNLGTLQDQMNAGKAKTDNNFDYLVSTGQAQNFRKLSNDPNFQPIAPGSLANQPPINGVPSVPKPVTSTMNVETLRQIEQQRVNAIPKPDVREVNSRIPNPGTRRF